MRARYLAISLLLVYFALGVVLAEETKGVIGGMSNNSAQIVNATQINDENVSTLGKDEVTDTSENETLVANETEEAGIRGGAVKEAEEIRPPQMKKPERVCSEYIKNLKEAIKITEEEYRIKIGRELDYIRAKIILAGMNVVIGKGQEYNANITGLISLRDEFKSKMEEINKTLSKKDMKGVAQELIRIAKEFKKEAHEIPELENNSKDVAAAVINAMKQEKEIYRKILENRWKLAKRVDLAAMDLHICRAQEKINRFYNLGFNVTLAQEKLDEIKDLKDDLEKAYDSGNKTEVIKTKILIAKKWGEFHRAFIRLNAKVMAYKYVKEKQKVVGLIKKLEKKGVNTGQLKNKLKVLDREIKNLGKVKGISELHKFSNEFNKMKRELEKIKKPIPVPPKKIQKKVLPPKKF